VTSFSLAALTGVDLSAGGLKKVAGVEAGVTTAYGEAFAQGLKIGNDDYRALLGWRVRF
jgi:hypothetical protein